MKKVVFVITLLLSVSGYAEKMDLSNQHIVEKFGANIVKEKLDTYDAEALGLWYLKRKYDSKWSKVRNDEFELDDAKIWAFKQLKNKLDKVKLIDKSSEYHLNLGISFGKYDFKSESFPIKALSENSYMQYSGKGEFVASYNNSNLIFEKFDDSLNFLSMKKDDAKKFIKARKDKYGSIDRELVAHYVYTITNIEEDREFSSAGNAMTIKFTGKLKSVEFMDKKGKKVLKTINFDQELTESVKNTELESNVTKMGTIEKNLSVTKETKKEGVKPVYNISAIGMSDMDGVIMAGEDRNKDRKVKYPNGKTPEDVFGDGGDLDTEIENNPSGAAAEAYRKLNKSDLGLKMMKLKMQ